MCSHFLGCARSNGFKNMSDFENKKVIEKQIIWWLHNNFEEIPGILRVYLKYMYQGRNLHKIIEGA